MDTIITEKDARNRHYDNSNGRYDNRNGHIFN